MELIHATAVVDPRARLGRDVSIGPYCVVGPEVTLGDETVLKSHVHIEGLTEVGPRCTVFPFASLGAQTQDLKFRGGTPGVKIGSDTTLREYVTVNAATFDGDFTVVGSHCHIMAYAHIAHDCRVGDRVIIANAGTLAGHVVIEDQAIIGGLCGIHQFLRIGRLSITGGCSKVVKDVPPFMMADGHPLKVYTINKVGLERAGVPAETVDALKKAYTLIYRRNLTVEQAVERMRADLPGSAELEQLIGFLQTSERGITR
ncbi:MAG TPA: acyl-ACP--UDP-N-acetylglucosamine O-acyltransferase [Kiritimatiellia bacterium]|nr:acyl-ACP--UDP-N-acetylglucosamine O-acyltransferase [Kiritimatiellia bacterium]